jgi:cell wall-associated NlpC family hydrolase
MSNSMAQATARITEIRSMIGLLTVTPLSGSVTTTAASSAAQSSDTGFAEALSGALATSKTASTAAPGTASDVGRRAVELARGYTGVPYLWGGTNPSKGLDCSGLVQLVYGKLGVKLPRVAADQARAGTKVASLAQAKPGDLVFFGSPAHHVGIYVGNGKMIDAPRRGSTVGVHNIAGYGTVSAIRRPSGGAATSAASGAGRATGLDGPYAALFTSAGRRYGIDPALLSAIAKTESGYNPSAVSPAGARGLMQLMPGTARSLGVNPDNPTQAVDGAARLVKKLLGQFKNNTNLALAAYNAGPGAVQRYGGIPPYSETRTYVQRVNRAWEALR